MKNWIAFAFLILAVGIVTPCVAADAEPNPGSMQLARQVVDLQTNDDLRKKTSDTMILMVTPIVLRDNPGKQDAVSAIMQKTFAPIMQSAIDDSARQTAELYIQTFSDDELRQLIAFQQSAVGIKFKRFNQETLPKVKDFARSAITAKTLEATQALVKELKAEKLNVPKELAPGTENAK